MKYSYPASGPELERIASHARGEPPVVQIIYRLTAGFWGGIEIGNVQFAAQLTRRGIPTRITLIGDDQSGRIQPEYAAEVDIETIPWRARSGPSLLDWHRIMRARPAQTVVFSAWGLQEPGLAMLALAKRHYRRVVVCYHNTVPLMRPAPPARALGGLLPRPHTWRTRQRLRGCLMSATADTTICVSHAARDRLVEHYGFLPNHTVTVHTGFDGERFRFDPQARARVRNEFGISESAVVFGALGRLHNEIKRHDLSLEAFARLVHAHPAEELHFLLVGDGPDRDALLQLASKLGVSSRVTLAPFTARSWEAHCALDIFLLPSTTEGLARALAEAMACERCVIAMAVEGVAEVLPRAELGFPVPPDDAEGFFAAMLAALRLGAAGRQAIGGRARAWIRQRFDFDQQLNRLVTQVLGHR